MYRFLTLILFVFSGTLLSAQVLAPDFFCVKNDTLFWDTPINNCGAFLSYDIYVSTEETGPYSLLGQVVDVNQTDFHHINTGGILFYYYIESNYDCPGQTILSSDTLTNAQPPVAVIQSASVNGNTVELNWQISDEPNVIGYIIYRQNPVGVVPIDTVYNTTFYLDENASPSIQPEVYYVLALDACGETSIFDDLHKTVFLEGDIQECDNFFSLQWNAYEGWINGVEKYEIWLSINTAASTNIAEVNGATLQFEYEELNDGNDYCFEVRAFENGSNNEIRSSELCLALDFTQPITNFDITQVSVLENMQINIGWVWNDNAEINQYQIEYSEDGVDYLPLVSNLITPPLSMDFGLSDLYSEISPVDRKYFFQISTLDDCDRTAVSTYGSTIHLTAINQENTANFIQWTALDFENTTVVEYELFRIVEGIKTSIAILDATTNQYLDNINISEQLSEICYQIEAEGSMLLSTGDEKPIFSTSNIACATQQAIIYAPNAFAPTGVNRIFKPVIVFGDNAQYSMSIYDRYGQQIFNTENINDGWDGNIKSRHATQGIYVYHIQVTQLDGQVTEKQGTVLLIR